MALKSKPIRGFVILSSIVLASAALLWLWKGKDIHRWMNRQPIGPEEVMNNYSKDIYSEAERLNLNPEYFMALCMLECGGRKPSPSRFEKHVFNRLMDLKAGKRETYEKVTTRTLKNANGSAIKNLSSSWGPFQIMGYKVVQQGILVKDLRGRDAVKHGMNWIAQEYGHLLKKDLYSDAFHYHNTGRVIGKDRKVRTYSKNYVKDGRKWMKYFKEKRNE